MVDVPAEQIVTDRLTVRRETADGAAAVAESIGRNHSRLLPWLGWATQEAADVAVQTRRIAHSDERWESREMFDYGNFDRSTGVFAGKISMHRRVGPCGVELGYWLDRSVEGRGVVTEAVTATMDEALRLDGIERVEIHCDAANSRSNAVPRRLGFVLDRIESRVVAAASETGQRMVWVHRPART